MHAEEPKPQLFYIYDVVAKPTKFMDYESAIKQLISAHTKHGFPFPYTVYSTNDLHYIVVIPISNYASIDEFMKAAKEDEKLWQKTMSVCRNYEVKIGRPRPDLSYAPKTK